MVGGGGGGVVVFCFVRKKKTINKKTDVTTRSVTIKLECEGKKYQLFVFIHVSIREEVSYLYLRIIK